MGDPQPASIRLRGRARSPGPDETSGASVSKPVILVIAGVALGAVLGLMNVGGEVSYRALGMFFDGVAAVPRLIKADLLGPQRPVVASGPQSQAFSVCLSRSNKSLEKTLRNLLEFHEHDATLTFVECLLDSKPERFCDADGAAQVADAMEIYLWSRDDSRRSTPAHDVADKIHVLERAAQEGKTDDDPFIVTWSGPRDRALFDKVRDLAKQGYLDPGAFAYSGRAELRETLRGVQPAVQHCVRTASP